MKDRNLLWFVLILALVTMSCGLPSGLTGGDETEPPAGGSDDTLAIASLEELNSYRLNIVWRGESEDGSEGFTLRILQEWVKEPPAQHFVMTGQEPGQEPVPMMEYIVIGDQAWIGMGGTWMETDVEQAEGMAQTWGAFMGDEEGWERVGPETVNDVRCQHYASGDMTTVSVPDPDEGGTVTMSVKGESWVADEGDLPPVVIRERVEIEGGFLPFALASGSASEADEGKFFMDYDLTDINATIVIAPPDEAGQLPVEPPAGEPAGDQPTAQPPESDSPSDQPQLPPPPAETQTKARAIDNMLMHYIPVGQFIMGDDDSAFAPERPAHLVFLDGYWIDETEVTNAQYRLCVDAGACAPPQSWDKPDLAGDQQPALTTWTQADAYCRWVGGRLPTEAEWEKAARGTDGRLWPWGDTFEDGRANLSGDGDGYKATAPVGMFPGGASPYGLLDMAGNAAEWVADWYAADYYGNSPTQNPTGPASGDERVKRSTIADGGGGPEKCRTVARYPATPDAPNWISGFRCAKTTQP